MVKKMNTMSVYRSTVKRTSIGRGKVKTSTMNKSKEKVGKNIVVEGDGTYKILVGGKVVTYDNWNDI